MVFAGSYDGEPAYRATSSEDNVGCASQNGTPEAPQVAANRDTRLTLCPRAEDNPIAAHSRFTVATDRRV
jgi:hypothetical protein